MAFTSTLYKGEVVIDTEWIDDPESNDFTKTPPDMSKGLEMRPLEAKYGTLEYCGTFPRHLLIPRSEWQARIQEREERKQTLSYRSIQAGLPCKDQNGTNYCWANAPVHCYEIRRMVQNQPLVLYSPGSIAGPIKNYRNVGGWGYEALKYLVEKGVVPVSHYGANQVRNAHTAETRELAAKNRVKEWWELRPRNLDEQISCLLWDIPTANGYNWWGHEVTGVDPVWLDGTVALRIRNSWGMGWGSKGFSILQGNKMLADDICAAIVTSPV